MDAQDELITDFIEEAKEIIDKLDIGVVELEKTPRTAKILAMFFGLCTRSKAAAGFLHSSGLKK